MNPTREENKVLKDAISSLLKSKFHEDVRPHIEHVMSSKDTELVFLRMHIARKDTEDKKAEYVDCEVYECLAITYAVLDGHMVIDFVATADKGLNNPESMFPLYQGQLHNPVPERDVEHKDRPRFNQFMHSTGSFELMLHVSQAIACEAIKADIKTTNKSNVQQYINSQV